jgi:hypothetical protein
MNREKLFEEFIQKCKERREFCGQGNPNGNILIIGKEPYRSKEIKKEEVEFQRQLLINYNLCRNKAERDAPRIKDKNPTWANYQRLIDPSPDRDPNVRDFEKKAFTTELNTMFRPKATLDAETIENIKKRLLFFKESDFIQSFLVVILACGNFISNDEERGFLINNTFGVEYDIDKDSTGKPKGEHKDIYKSGHWFYTHHSKNGEKLVIHTRQLSNLFDYQIIDHMASVIKDHLDHLEKLGKI